VCSGTTCAACGGANQPCCAGNACDDPTNVCWYASVGMTCQPCGGDGQPCCNDGGCSSGGCCNGNRCVAAGKTCGNGTCTNGSCGGCGGPGEPCCSYSCTTQDYTCDNSTTKCVHCGGVGEPCCQSGTCATGCCQNYSTCADVGQSCGTNQGCFAHNDCEYCGIPGALACPGLTTCAQSSCYDPATKRCIAPGESGTNPTTVCVAGTFQTCGGPGQPCCGHNTCGGGGCCAGDKCVAPGSACGGTLSGNCSDTALGGCGTCGGEGQSCCAGNSGRSSSSFCTGAGLACYGSTCSSCGGPGEPCCEGNTCAGYGCCVSNKCVAAGSNCGGSYGGVCDSGACRSASAVCGGLGSMDLSNCSSSSCYAPWATDDSLDCVPCGLDGQSCCNGYYGYCASGYACDFDHCTTCGLSGKPCCEGGFCKVGTCSSGTCP
jgi:hypothetical protein